MNPGKENDVLAPQDVGPVAIGGGGGSGTRLVADIVSQCGFYLGCPFHLIDPEGFRVRTALI